MNDDKLHIEQFLHGEEKGFEMLVGKYQNRVLNIVYSLVGKDNESEDISQDVFLKVYHGLKSFKQQSQFSTWLYRIVVNTTYDALRKRKKIIYDEEILTKSTDDRNDPKDILFIEERETIIKNALGKIPIKYRTALVLKDIEGLSYIEISRVLCCHIGTVESRIYRARQFLKKELFNISGELI
ncbi:MAG: hypothetical protein A2Y03_10220 [Omnitrophica WOR_2 bacterium GWF2_38_59]|nr:MAG: hypothetical protein A2Y03_10220 [Omnitrophica WOR_2 bacterium GWF2_38_59]